MNVFFFAKNKCTISFAFFLSFLQDSFILETPGGGGFGASDERKQPETLMSHSGADHSTKRLSSKDPHSFTERGSIFEYRKAQESV